ncbi:DUF6543 domain-containing protein [Pseudomonas sp. MWU13-2517]|uniref:dermonecrotic toxin domain-containing protein n=1 Tax=Pseudomonas sp. MWU13-2517 TaxID=2929055 RepID=UPI00200F78DE|nr:DUF6543 domain-containing protein [Pseudomonas sp. MWU13-2517]
MSVTTYAASPVSSAVSSHFANRPALASIARQLLATLIAQAFPDLSIDLSRTQLAMPAMGGGWTLRPFMSLVLDSIADGTPLDVSEREGRRCFLTDHPPTPLKPAGKAGLDMGEISSLVNALPWLLPIALQNTLSEYWRTEGEGGVSRWRWLSDTLMDGLSLSTLNQADLTSHERSLLGQLVDYPDRDLRIERFGARAVHAYFPHATLKTSRQTQRLLSPDLLLLGQDQGKPHVLLCPLAGPCERFAAIDTALQAWAGRMTRDVVVEHITLQRFEPDGNLFDIQAAILLNQQLQQLQALDLPARQGLGTLQAVYHHLTDPASTFAEAPAAGSSLLETLRDSAAPWLKNASSADRARYRHYSLKLASAKKRSGGRTFLSDLPDIRSFTRTALLDQLKRDEKRFGAPGPEQGDAAHVQPDDLQLTFSVAVGYPGGAGFVETVHMSLTDLAINNLQAQPRGRLAIAHRQGLPLPAWLTADYINGSDGLIQQLDIGRVYPELLKTHLMGDSEDTQQRQQSFAEQTMAHLPLLALELSLTQAHGFTAEGAAYVAALMAPSAEQRQVDGQAVVIRHLALVRKPQATPDEVSNMYIIESEGRQAGPHILYRPLYPDALQQFASREHLLQAIAEPGQLQDSVLTWLSDGARPIYADGGFRQPHYVRFGSGDEFELPEVPKPATLAVEGVSDELLQFLGNGHLMEYLYGSNARALVDQADRTSVSNTESRWKVLMEGAGLLFGTLLLPLARGPLMLTGWLLSLMAAATRDIPALNSQDPVARELAVVDLLLNIGLLIFQWAPPPRPALQLAADSTRQALRQPFAQRLPEQWPRPPEPLMDPGPVLLDSQAPALSHTVVDFSFSSARHRLSPTQRALLSRLQAPVPETVPEPVLNGPRKGLYYFLRDWYAQVDARWYQVRLAPEGDVVIVDPFDTTRLGPYLRTDGQGNWSLDLRLRLRGGMPLKRIAAERERKLQRKVQLVAERDRFLNAGQELRDGRLVPIPSVQQALQTKVDTAEALMKLAATDAKYSDAARANTRKNFDTALNEQTAAYQGLLDSRQERNELGIPIPDAVAAIFLENAVNNLRKSVVIADMDRQALYNEHQDLTVPYAQAVPAILADTPRYAQFLKDMSLINERQINALTLKDRYLLELFNLGRPGLDSYNRLTVGRTEELSALELKHLQLQNYKYLSKKHWQTGLFKNSLDTALDPLGPHIRTHSELNVLNLSAAERLEVLDSLFQHYGQALDALQGMEMVQAEELDADYFQRTKALVDSLYQDVVQQLAGEVKPQVDVIKRPSKRPLTGTGGSAKKLIRTRKQGYLIGELQPAGSRLDIEVVEMRSEQDNKLLATYSQHEDNWDEVRFERRTSAPVLPPGTRALNIVKGAARKRLQALASIIKREEGYAQVSRFPIEIQESLEAEAARFDDLAGELDRAVEAQSTAERVATDQLLVDELRAAARMLVDKGKALRTQRTLALPPTDSHLAYLIEQDQVQIGGLGPRQPMKGERQDFIQEFVVNDNRGYPLWFAHFHYPEASTPKQAYTVAHLKTREQRKESYYSLLAKAQSPQSVVDVHRGALSRALAERWFLPLAL